MGNLPCSSRTQEFSNNPAGGSAQRDRVQRQTSVTLPKSRARRFERFVIAILTCPVLCMPTSDYAAEAMELITASEASLPNAVPRGITRSPGIRLVSPPAGAKAVASPFPFKIEFAPHGGAHIDPATVRLTYLKLPLVDLTPRIGPYLTGSGIQIPNAQVPPGKHALKLEMRDSDGRTAETLISLIVLR